LKRESMCLSISSSLRQKGSQELRINQSIHAYHLAPPHVDTTGADSRGGSSSTRALQPTPG
jgi:hypothetical protein